jgi:hypothetical protein
VDQIFHLAKISLASLPCLSMHTLLKHAYSTRLISSRHAKMSAIVAKELLSRVNRVYCLRLFCKTCEH